MGFENRIAVVTGATSGIGEHTARLLLQQGAKVLGLGRNAQKAQELERLGNFTFYEVDFLCNDQIEDTCRRICEEYPRIDILVNNAGISPEGTVETLSLTDWQDCFQVNVTAAYLMCKYIIPAMRQNGYGRIVNIASTAGTVGAPTLHAYASTKGALIQLTRSLAASYAHENILTNCVCPGGTLTPMLLNMQQQACDEFAQRFPIKRLAQPDEIANVILFVAGEQASFMAGSIVMVDGGFTCI